MSFSQSAPSDSINLHNYAGRGAAAQKHVHSELMRRLNAQTDTHKWGEALVRCGAGGGESWHPLNCAYL